MRARRGTTGYAMSQHARPRIEPAFGWLKTIAWIRKVKLRGLAKVDWLFVFASAAFNLIRLPKLLRRVAAFFAGEGDDFFLGEINTAGFWYFDPPTSEAA